MSVTSDDGSERGESDAALAFAALQAQVASLRQAVEALPAIVEGATRVTDYAPTLGAVLLLRPTASRALYLRGADMSLVHRGAAATWILLW